jgi:hypothetical protein
VRAALLARALLGQPAMASARPDESWTIPLQVFMWTVIVVGFVMMLAVFLMH